MLDTSDIIKGYVGAGPKARDVMVDLETVDNLPTSGIASIGACIFSKDGVFEKFYVVVDYDTCLKLGMTQSQGTMDWWATQSEQARNIFHPDTVKMALPQALQSFSDWYKLVGGCEFWGNGADFDNAIMAVAYALAKMKQPWKYSNNRCFRTIKNGAFMRKREGVYHNALDDAITQAQFMIDNKLCPPR